MLQRGTVVVALWAAACGFSSDVIGDGVGVAESMGTTTGESTQLPPPASSSPPPGTSVGTDPAMTSAGSSSGVDPSETGVTSMPIDDVGGTTGEVAMPASCAEVLADDPTAPSAVYRIWPPAATLDVPISVYCDMKTDGGGWMLVGRSVDAGADEGDFGWGSQRGSIEDPAQPYSLDAKSAGVPFSQILIGNHAGTYAWGGRIYRVDVPADFLTHSGDAVASQNITTLAGNCDPSGGPDMLRHVGHTDDTLVFWLRDQSGFSRFGMWHDGFDMYGFGSFFEPCSHGARLDGDPGMFMTR